MTFTESMLDFQAWALAARRDPDLDGQRDAAQAAVLAAYARLSAAWLVLNPDEPAPMAIDTALSDFAAALAAGGLTVDATIARSYVNAVASSIAAIEDPIVIPTHEAQAALAQAMRSLNEVSSEVADALAAQAAAEAALAPTAAALATATADLTTAYGIMDAQAAALRALIIPIVLPGTINAIATALENGTP